jgi:EmrB/QacA subfamily drug resistance transporter
MSVLPTTAPIRPVASPSPVRLVPPVQDSPAVLPIGIILVVMLGNFLGPLYSSVANVAIPNLSATFGSDVDTMEWVVTGYMLGYSVSMPVAGWLADTFGRRRIYLLGLVLFTAFSVLLSLSWSTTSLIAFRVAQAVGGGLVSPTGMAIITDVVPPKLRGRALGFWGMGMMLAPAFGPWIAGAIINNLDDWRPIFLLGVPVGIAGVIASYIVLPKSEDRRETAAAFDFAGFAALTIALVAFLVPLTQGNRVGWDEPWISESFVLAVLSFTGFIWRELTAASPMLDLSLFRDRTFAIAVGMRGVLGSSYYFALFLLPLFTQDLLGWTPDLSGFILVPGGVLMALLMPISGTLADRYGARPFVFAGMIVAAVGTFAFARIDTDWDMTRIAMINAFRSGAMGLLFTPLTAAALASVPRNRAGSASGILNTIWQVCGSIAIAIGQSYLSARIWLRSSETASGAVLSRPAVQPALEHMRAMLAQHGLPPSDALVMLANRFAQAAAVQAYGDTFLLGAIIAAAAVPLALLLRRPRTN